MNYQTIKIRKETHHQLKIQAAERGETLMDLIDRLARQERQVATFRERKLIAQIQVLVSTHRFPAMYNVEGVLSDAEQLWKEANDELLRQEDATGR